MSEMQADFMREIERVQRPVLADELTMAVRSLGDAIASVQSASYRLGLLVSGADPTLPAPALTEDAIVAALKADPAMAGRVIGQLVRTLGDNNRRLLAQEAGDVVRGRDLNDSYHLALQSLAVALAAASYRG